MTFNDLELRVIKWANDRNLIKPENDKGQLCKTMEELGELVKATLKNNTDMIIDGIGDVVVTLIIFAAIKNLNLVYCLEQAYNEIAGRTGKTENGVFIKDK